MLGRSWAEQGVLQSWDRGVSPEPGTALAAAGSAKSPDQRSSWWWGHSMGRTQDGSSQTPVAWQFASMLVEFSFSASVRWKRYKNYILKLVCCKEAPKGAEEGSVVDIHYHYFRSWISCSWCHRYQLYQMFVGVWGGFKAPPHLGPSYSQESIGAILQSRVFLGSALLDLKLGKCLMSEAWDQRDITRGLEVTNNFLLCLPLQMGITSKLMLPWKPQMLLDFCPTPLVSCNLSWMCVYPWFCTWTSDDNCDFFHMKRITAFVFGAAFTLFSVPGCTVVAWIG